MGSGLKDVVVELVIVAIVVIVVVVIPVVVVGVVVELFIVGGGGVQPRHRRPGGYFDRVLMGKKKNKG